MLKTSKNVENSPDQSANIQDPMTDMEESINTLMIDWAELKAKLGGEVQRGR